MPLPVIVAPPGLAVTVQIPDAGNPLSATLPVGTPHMGWVIAPTTGAVGVTGAVLISADPEEREVQPLALVTVNV